MADIRKELERVPLISLTRLAENLHYGYTCTLGSEVNYSARVCLFLAFLPFVLPLFI